MRRIAKVRFEFRYFPTYVYVTAPGACPGSGWCVRLEPGQGFSPWIDYWRWARPLRSALRVTRAWYRLFPGLE